MPTGSGPKAFRVREGYDRQRQFGNWINADHEGCNTRAEVMRAEALQAPAVTGRCTFSGGSWYSYYDDQTTDRVDIDHLEPGGGPRPVHVLDLVEVVGRVGAAQRVRGVDALPLRYEDTAQLAFVPEAPGLLRRGEHTGAGALGDGDVAARRTGATPAVARWDPGAVFAVVPRLAGPDLLARMLR
ncbi:hypothetical protein ACWGCI_27020 [Streptomyces sp. NPDC054949]